jgi:hypothetical protein
VPAPPGRRRTSTREQHLLASGRSWTFLRDNRHLDLLPRMVGDDDAIGGPAGDGRVSAVATDDVPRLTGRPATSLRQLLTAS